LPDHARNVAVELALVDQLVDVGEQDDLEHDDPAAALTPIGVLSELTSFGTLFAFAMVCLAVWLLRRREPNRERPFRVPVLGTVAPLGILTNVVLICMLSPLSQGLAVAWLALGLLVYFAYSRHRSHLNAG
jgi:APA family basic amino acid/polyamine antiporter